MNPPETPYYVGPVAEFESGETLDDGRTRFYVYGPKEHEIIADTVNLNETQFDGYHIFTGFEDMYIVETGGDLVLTDVQPDGFSPEPIPTMDITVAIETHWESEYVQIEEEWYHGTEAGDVYMHQRNDTMERIETEEPPGGVEEYTVTLFDPDGGGGTFWAKCGDVVASGDMPEEAITQVVDNLETF